MVSNLDDLAAAQTGIGKSITQLSENFRKERTERRTIDVTKGYEEKLNELWGNFCTNHENIEEISGEDEQHPYFTKEYYKQVSEEYYKLAIKIKARLEELKGTSTEDRATLTATKEGSPMALKIQRQLKSAISSLERLLNTTEEALASPQSAAFYNLKLKTINQYWERIASLNAQLVAELDGDYCELDTYADIEDQYQAVTIRIQEKLDEKPVGTANIGNVKLPKITLPIFDGNYTKWRQFKDLFSQLIHNRQMSGSEKMYYLKANLTGEPSGLIKHLEATDDNYAVGWKILLERYDNTRVIVTAILNQFLAQPVLTNETTSGIKRLHDTCKECLLALQNMDIHITEWSPLLLHLLLQKLDKESRRMYEQSLKSPRELQSIEDFFKFLETRFQMLEAVQTREERKRASILTASSQAHQCPVCKLDHKVFRCSKFLYMPIENRIRLIRRLDLCANCLRNDHKTRDCSSRGCTKCNKRHNTLIHYPQQEGRGTNNVKPRLTSAKQAHANVPAPLSQDNKGPQQSASYQSSSHQASGTSLKASTSSHIILATAVIKVVSHSGVPLTCRALLDSGSQLHFVSERLVQALGLQRQKISLPISGIGGIETVAKHETTITIQSRIKDFSTVISAVILKNISELQPSRYLNISNWKIPSNVQLADPAFYKPQAIDILLGADLYLRLLEDGQIKLRNDLPLLQNTCFGWIVSGKVQNEPNSRSSCHIATLPSNSALDKQLQQFWELKHHDAPSKFKSTEEAKCEEHFQNTFQRSSSGRYIVRLPFRNEPSTLGSSLELAKRGS